MSLEVEIISEINTIFKQAALSMEIKEFLCVRPVSDGSYENYEPIHDVVRLFECHPLHMCVYLSYKGKCYEYRLKYANGSRELDLVEFQLLYADFSPEEDPKKIEAELRPLMGLVFASVIPDTLRRLSNLKNEG